MKNDLETREDVKLLVSRIYKKVRANEEIGFFFNNTIQDLQAHIEKLWNMILLI